MTPPDRRILGAALGLALLSHGERFLVGEWAPVRITDAFDVEAPQWLVVGRLLLAHGLFQWSPQMVGGQPSHAYHFTPLYPLAIVAQFLPLWLVYAALKTLYMTIAGYGMFRLGRDYLGLAPRAAIAAGAVFALSSYTQKYALVFTPFNYAFPLLVVWTLGLHAGGRRRWVLAGLGALALSLLSYPALTAPFYATLQVLLILLLNPLHRARTGVFLTRTLVFWAGYTLLFVPLLYAMGDFASIAQRVRTPTLDHPLTYLAEDGPELLARSLLVVPVGGAVAVASRSAAVRRAIALAAIPLGLSFFFFSSLSHVLRDTFWAKIDLNHFNFLAPIVLTILAFLGLDAVRAQPALRRRWLLGGAVAVAVASPALFWRSAWANVFVLNLLVLAALALYLSPGDTAESRPMRRRLALGAVLVLATVVLRAHTVLQGQETVPYRRYFGARDSLAQLPPPKAATRAALVGFFPSPLQVAGFETADAFSPLFPARYKDVWKLVVAQQLTTAAEEEFFDTYPYSIELLSYPMRERFVAHLNRVPNCAAAQFETPLRWNIPLLLSMNVTTIVSLRPLPELAAVGDRVTTTCRDPLPVGSLWIRLKRYVNPPPLWVYHPRDAFERGYVVDRAEVLASDAAVLETLGQRSSAEFRRTVLLSAADGHRSDPAEPAIAPGPKSVRLRSYGPDRLGFDVTTAGPAYLVVSNNFHRYWRATVNGDPRSVLRANHAFQAVRIVAAGQHAIVLEYYDPWLWWSYAAVPLGMALVLAGARPARAARTPEPARR